MKKKKKNKKNKKNKKKSDMKNRGVKVTAEKIL